MWPFNLFPRAHQFASAEEERCFMKEQICAVNTVAVMALPLVGAFSHGGCFILFPPSDDDWLIDLGTWSLAMIISNFVCAMVVLVCIKQCKQERNWSSPQFIEGVLCLFMLALLMPLALQGHVQQQLYTSGMNVGLLLSANLQICASHIHLPIRVSKLVFIDLLIVGPALVGRSLRSKDDVVAFHTIPALGIVILILTFKHDHEKLSRRNYACVYEAKFRGLERSDANAHELHSHDDRVETQASDSLPETSEIGIMFEQVGIKGQGKSLTEQLRKMEALGRQEKWLINSNSLQIRPDKIMGAGTYGIVLGGMLQCTPVAVKVPRSSNLEDKDVYLQELANELRILRSVQHPNIVSFLGACVEPVTGDLALTLELVEGKGLTDFMQDHVSQPSIVTRYSLLVGICSGIDYLHSQSPRIVHGDLKANNVLVEILEPYPRAKLVDFGLSRSLTKHAKPLAGTLAYMAPEVALKKGAPLCSADVFSLGCVMFFVLTGQLPCGGLGREEILEQLARRDLQHITWPQNDPSATLPRSRVTIEQCVDYNPKLRPSIRNVYDSMLRWTEVTYMCSSSTDEMQKIARERCRIDTSETWHRTVQKVRAHVGATKKKVSDKRNHTPSEPQVGAKSVLQASRNHNQTDGCDARDPLVFPTLDPTPEKSLLISLVTAMLGWNSRIAQDSCCVLHHNVKLMLSLADDMLNSRCSDLGFDTPVQCEQCGLVEDFTGKTVPERWICSYHQNEEQQSMSSTVTEEVLSATRLGL